MLFITRICRNRDRVQQRIEQANSLLDRLTEFEKKHAALMELINEGEELLKTEQPVGKSAQRIEEQMATCQVSLPCSHLTCTCLPIN